MTGGGDLDIDHFRKVLQTRQAELDHLETLSREARAPVELDQQSVGRLSRMDAIQGQAMAIETARRRDLERQRIEAALQRIRDDEYGFCLQCDEEIAVARLELDPAIPVCIACAKQ